MVQSIDDTRRRQQRVGRIPPHNLEAEESLLGAMLLSGDAIAAAVNIHLSTEDFYKPLHGHIYDAICTLYAQGEPVDPVTVAEELRRADLHDLVGGLPALLSLEARTPATKGTEFAFDALAHDGGFVVGLGGFSEGVVNMAIGDATGAKVTRDTELALLADFGVSAGELPGVAGIVELARFFEASKNDLGEEFRIGAAQEFRFHFVDGVSAAHEDTEGVVVEVLLGIEFAGAGEHEGSIEEEVASG